MAAKQQSKRTRVAETISEMANALHQVGAIDDNELLSFDAAKIKKPRAKSAKQIKALRNEHNLEPATMAKLLNISEATLRAWERGDRKPSGGALRLLDIVSRHGISILY